MKKLFALLALVLGMVSCQTEPEGLDVVVGGEQDVNITVALPEGTRADSAQGFDLNNLGDYSIRYILEISYNGYVVRDVQISKQKSVKFPVRLAPGRYYTFTVWADLVTATTVDKETWYTTDLYYNTADGLDEIEVIAENWTPNTEARDAWTATKTETYTSTNKNIGMTLTRPFAKVRVVATDIQEIRNFRIKPTNATVEYLSDVYVGFNAVDGKVVETSNCGMSHAFNYVDVDTYEDYETSNQLTVFTDYLFVPADGNIKFTLSVYDNEKADALIKQNNFNTTIPVAKNKITTIKGHVLTDGGDLSVDIENGFDNEDNLEKAPYYQVAVTGGVELIKALQEGREIIVLNDITVTEADLALATRAGEAKNPVLNLNGYTITVKNTTGEALVDLNGGALKVEGNGAIESDNGALVEGTTVVTGGATVDAKVAVDENGDSAVKTGVEALAYICKNGGEFNFTEDLTAADVILVSATEPVVINGANYKLSTSANRAIRVTSSKANVTVNDLNVVSSAVMTYPSDVRGISIDASISEVTLELNNCTIDFTDKTTNDWTYAVNVSGNGTGHKVTINGGVYEGANVVNAHSAKNTIVVKNATLTSLYPNNDMYSGACIWVLQNQGSTVYAEGNTFNGNNAVAFNLGTGTTLEEKDNTDNTKYVAAKVNGAYYYNIAEAIAAAEDGATIKVLQSHDCNVAATVPAGKTLTLDLNGKTVNGADTTTGSFGLITNKGNLLVKNGTVTLKAENNRGWNAYSSVISNSVGGNLIVENVTLEHLGGTDMAYGIDNLTNGKGTSAITNINKGAVVKSTYRAVRQFLNGIEATNELYVNAGAVVEGENKSIWMQDPSAKANTGKLVVAEGATLYGDVYLFVTAGSTEWPVEVSIADAAFAEGSTVVTGNVPADYKVVEKDGVWTVAPNFNDNFAENTWENIIKACQNNCVPETWNVGDTKAMTIAGKDYQIRILGKNHDTYTAGGKAPLTFQIAEVYGVAPMNATQTNTTGWSGSQMRTKTMAEILEVMPVKDAIKAVNKETLNGTRDGLETTSDKLFLLSEVEVNGSVYFSNNFAEGSHYAFFGDVDSMKLNATYWLRGPGKNNAIGYTQINMSGYMANGSAEYACGVVFGFCF